MGNRVLGSSLTLLLLTCLLAGSIKDSSFYLDSPSCANPKKAFEWVTGARISAPHNGFCMSEGASAGVPLGHRKQKGLSTFPHGNQLPPPASARQVRTLEPETEPSRFLSSNTPMAGAGETNHAVKPPPPKKSSPSRPVCVSEGRGPVQ